ncbi:GNAT family N-acetyltransferase [Candidatus Chloroploca sp. Khr17]|uniref:GNAT family N-acetyltransferase n=1 Tax=Candidatus Chloroploca sp. Khr17 TaxID=2496869 RepID=UPI00101D07E1|nr:GNAT family N-acetyltransferase [Candidatus Chloroploca sp. Khr17]
MNESTIKFRKAIRTDLERIVQLLADDPLGSQREVLSTPLARSYVQAFEAIAEDENNELVVAQQGATIIGVLQLTFIPYLTHQGSWRALIEGVRVAAEARSAGVGRQLFTWAIRRASERGCRMVQLTSDKSRPDAIRFYESLGFVASHEGMKLQLAHGSVSDA